LKKALSHLPVLAIAISTASGQQLIDALKIFNQLVVANRKRSKLLGIDKKRINI